MLELLRRLSPEKTPETPRAKEWPRSPAGAAYDVFAFPRARKVAVLLPAAVGYHTWSHACNSADALAAALADRAVSAIEADVSFDEGAQRAVMAHDAGVVSDLTLATFLSLCVADGFKHLKIDFKDPKVVDGCVDLLNAAHVDQLADNAQGVWLNADVLPLSLPSKFDADAFVKACARVEGAVPSLGWRVDLRADASYSDAAIDAMVSLSRRHGLEEFVVAANLRMVLADIEPLKRLMAKCPKAMLLLWTGSGEPSIHSSAVAAATHALRLGPGRLGFDVVSTDSALRGKVHDIAISAARFYRRRADLFRRADQDAPLPRGKTPKCWCA